MNALTTASILTMSSLEIAELTGKRHADVMRDIRSMLEQLELTERSFASSYIDSTGRSLPCFHLPKRETNILVSGYSVVLRSRIVDRWMELEEQVAKPVVSLPDFTNPAIAARAWADEVERKLAAQAQVKDCQITHTHRVGKRCDMLTHPRLGPSLRLHMKPSGQAVVGTR